MHQTMHLTYSIYDSIIIGMKAWMPDEIETLRKNHGLTRKAMGELLGVAGNHVYLLERGLRKPSNTLRVLLGYVERELNENEKEKGKVKHGKAQRAL